MASGRGADPSRRPGSTGRRQGQPLDPASGRERPARRRAPVTRRRADLAEARALAHPDRLRIIRLTFDAELTNKQLADLLGRDPATVLHHVRTLVDAGFLEALPVRRGERGARERPYRSTGKSWTLDLDPDLVDEDTAAVVEAFQAEVFESPPEDRSLTRLALRLSPEQHEELDRRLAEVIEEAASWEPEVDGEPWALFVAIHRRPDLRRPDLRDPALDRAGRPRTGA
jgi:DNA-binding transcriptional ArsR family regulator